MSGSRVFLAPLWWLSVATGASSFCDNPVIGSRRLNERGLHIARVQLAQRMAASRRARLAHLVSDADRASFERDGLVVRRDFLPRDTFARLESALFSRPFPARDMVQGDTITRRFAVDPALLRDVPAARVLLDDPDWRGLTRYVGSSDTEPLVYVQSILTHARKGRPDPQTRLHADVFYPTMKAWFFLTDVAADEGAFTYVPGSHRMTPQRLEWERAMSLKAPDGVDRLSARGSFRISPEELESLGLPPPRRLAVPANTLVVADTSGFHARGPSERASTRVEIWAYGRRNPFLPWTGLDPTSVRGIAERRVPWAWRGRDRLAQLGWMSQPWRDVGMKTPGEH